MGAVYGVERHGSIPMSVSLFVKICIGQQNMSALAAVGQEQKPRYQKLLPGMEDIENNKHPSQNSEGI